MDCCFTDARPLVDFGVHGGDRCSTPVHQTVTSTGLGSHLLYRLIRSCLTAMTSDTPRLRSVSSKNHELCLRSHPSIQAHHIIFTSSLHHLCKAICHSSLKIQSPHRHYVICQHEQLLRELTKQYLDTVVIQSHYTAHRISSSKPVSFAQLTGGGVL